MKGWGWLAVASLFEVGFTATLKLQQADDRWGPAFLLCAVASFECLARALRTLPMGLAYAVWTGIGSVGAFVVGVTAFGDPRSPLRVALVVALVACLVALKVVSGAGHANEPAPRPRQAGR